MHRALVALLLFSFLPALRGQEGDDPIDRKVAVMLEKNPSTAGTTAAMDVGARLWDQAMNQAYEKLLAALDKEDRPALHASQRAWIAFRDANAKAMEKIYAKAEGTMYHPAPSGMLLDLCKARTQQLRAYLEAAQSARD